jgi:hypothetical protein
MAYFKAYVLQNTRDKQKKRSIDGLVQVQSVQKASCVLSALAE